jgi:hypothetical protein
VPFDFFVATTAEDDGSVVDAEEATSADFLLCTTGRVGFALLRTGGALI